jgi:hypothetical protein
MTTSRFSFVGNSIRFAVQVDGETVDVELGKLDSDCTPSLPYEPTRINRDLVVAMGCPKLDREPVSRQDLADCRQWLDEQGFIRVNRIH